MTSPLDPKAIFQDAMELEAAERAPFVEGACGGDAKVRARVEALLAAAADAGTFLASPIADSSGDAAPAEHVGAVIGHYTLQQLIGEGGFGIVWMAEQTQPVRRQVALKLVKRGMDTRAVVARFEQERQALALMDHPNIAKVFDGGETGAGRPYFVMELVRGVPITQFCDQEHLDTKERLLLFVQVCHAVQHAHQKGVIHRDIKPSNVLVMLHDGTPVPKVIDFGIAKAVHRPLTEKTLFTEYQQMVGTPEYMSPEQAEMSGLDIDTRADIYALGVLVYELLTGSLPFDVRTKARDGLLEMLRAIREEEPQKPSTRISTQGATSTETAKRRRTDVRKLARMLSGDLDWIVLKALEKERSRRYVSADAFAADVLRHLRDEPVEAGPPGKVYRLRKYVRRHRVGVFAGTAVAAALLAGLSLALWGFVEASAKRDAAVKAGDEATAQTQLANEARVAAEAERTKTAAALVQVAEQRDRAEKIATFMDDTLQGVGPNIALGRDTLLLREMMDRAAARIENGELKDAPEAELQLRTTIGAIYRELAAFDAAARMLEPALKLACGRHDGDHRDVARVLNELACLCLSRGDPRGARVHSTRAVAMLQRLCAGRDDADLATMQNNHVVVLTALDELEPAQEQARAVVAMRKSLFGKDDVRVAEALNNLGAAQRADSKNGESEKNFRDAIEIMRVTLPDGDPRLASALNNLGIMLIERGDYRGAEPLLLEALTTLRKLMPGRHPDLAGCLNSLGLALAYRRAFDEAEALLEQSLAMRRELFPGGHTDVVISLSNMGWLLSERGDKSGAESYYLQALEMQQRMVPGAHSGTARCLSNLSSNRLAHGDLAGAEEMATRALEMRRELFPNGHEDVAISLNNLAGIREARGDMRAAEKLFRDAVVEYRKLFPDGDPNMLPSLLNLAGRLEARDETVESEALTREALAMAERLYAGKDDPLLAKALRTRAGVLRNLERNAEAEQLLNRMIAMRRGLVAGADEELARALSDVGILQRRRGDFEAAERSYRDSLEMHRRLNPAGDIDTAITLNAFGVLEAARKRPDAAEARYKEALKIYRRDVRGADLHLAMTLYCLGSLYAEGRDRRAAEAMHEEALKMRRQLLPPGHLELVRSLNAMAQCLMRRGARDEALLLLREALEPRRSLVPAADESVLLSLQGLARVQLERRELGEAEEAIRDAITMGLQLHANGSAVVAVNYKVLGTVLQERGDAKGAATQFRESLAMRARFVAADDESANTSVSLGQALMEAGDSRGAVQAFRDAVAVRRRLYPDGNGALANNLNTLGVLLWRAGELAEAETSFREAMDMFARASGADSEGFLSARVGRGRSLSLLGRFAEAESELLAAAAAMQKGKGPASANASVCRDGLVDLYRAWDKAEPGKGYEAKAAEWKARLLGK